MQIELSRIRVEPVHVVDLEMDGRLCGLSPPYGNRFTLSNGTNKCVLFDRTNKIGEFSIAGYPEVHPTEEILVVNEPSNPLTFYDFNGKELHRLEIHNNPHSYTFGFNSCGSFFLFCEVVGTNQCWAFSWAPGTSVSDLGDLNKAASSKEWGYILGGLWTKHPEGSELRTIVHYDHMGGSITTFDLRTPEGKIEFGPWNIYLEHLITFSLDGSEFIAGADDKDYNFCLRRFDNRNPLDTGDEYPVLGEAAWPAPFDLYSSEPESAFKAVYTDLVHALFLTCNDRRLFLLHTRSMTFEVELEIKGFDISLGNQASETKNSKVGSSKIDQIAKCGEYLLVVGRIECESNPITRLAFVNVDAISQAVVNC